jgi:hypothetical protein
VDALPRQPLARFLARADATEQMRVFFAGRGVEPMASPEGGPAPPLDEEEPLIADTPAETPPEGEGAAKEEEPADPKILSNLTIMQRVKLAMKGTREQRAQLVRDSNKLVSMAVLSSPKLTETEVEAFAKMANLTEDVLRVIGTNRAWTKNYTVISGLAKNPKTPPALSMTFLSRLNERDIKMLTTDRNAPEAVRLAAKKYLKK